MILFKDIYQKALNLMDDPDINRAYLESPIRFEKLMYPHLNNGYGLFTNPTAVAWKMTDQTPPVGQMEIFEYDEVDSNTVKLSTTPKEGSDFSFSINGKETKNASYNAADNTVTFEEEIPQGATVGVEWYWGGQFNADFADVATSKVPSSIIDSRVRDILARALVISWAEENKNFILEIRNILTDTDFKLYSPANAITSKVAWVKNLRFTFNTLQNKLNWDLFSVSRNSGGYYGR